MGKVNALLKVNVDDVDTDFDELTDSIREALPNSVSINDTDTEEVAFGLKALILLVEIPDAEGGTEKVEDIIESVDTVKSVTVENVDRV